MALIRQSREWSEELIRQSRRDEDELKEFAAVERSVWRLAAEEAAEARRLAEAEAAAEAAARYARELEAQRPPTPPPPPSPPPPSRSPPRESSLGEAPAIVELRLEFLQQKVLSQAARIIELEAALRDATADRAGAARQAGAAREPAAAPAPLGGGGRPIDAATAPSPSRRPAAAVDARDRGAADSENRPPAPCGEPAVPPPPVCAAPRGPPRLATRKLRASFEPDDDQRSAADARSSEAPAAEAPATDAPAADAPSTEPPAVELPAAELPVADAPADDGGADAPRCENQLGGKLERRFADGRRVVWFPNGTHKEVLPDGRVNVRFANGDVKRTTPAGVAGAEEAVTVYLYAEARTAHSTYHESRVEVFEFPNGQVERHYPDGRKDIRFPDGTRKTVAQDASGAPPPPPLRDIANRA